MIGRVAQRLRGALGAANGSRPTPQQVTAASIEGVAAAAERIAVLLGAGVAPGVALRHLADAERTPRARAVAEAAADSAALGDEVAAAIARAVEPVQTVARPARFGLPPARWARRRPDSPDRATSRPAGGSPSGDRGWQALAAAWAVAEHAGAPLGPALRSLASALRDEAALERAVAAALAGPRASARMVAALPLVAMAFGALLGFDTIGVLLGSPLGIGCALAGAALLHAGRRWNAGLAERASSMPVAPGLEPELVAIAMSGGLPLERARGEVAAALARYLPGASTGDGIEEVLDLASRAGAPVAELLRAEAARLRRTAQSEGVLRAEALAVRLMVPLGVCVLPAFALLGVAPLMISVVTGTLGSAS